MEPPVDLSRPVENSALVRALEAMVAEDTTYSRRELLRELNAANYLVPVLMDEAEIRPSSPGGATVSKGSIIKVLHCEDAEGGVWLGLFTDWDQIRAWTSEPVDTFVLSASDAWDFATNQDQYLGAVINPATHGLPIDHARLDYLRSLLGGQGG